MPEPFVVRNQVRILVSEEEGGSVTPPRDAFETHLAHAQIKPTLLRFYLAASQRNIRLVRICLSPGGKIALSHFSPFIFGVLLVSPHPLTQSLSPPYIGGNPYTITFFSSHLWCLTDVTSSPTTISFTFWGIHGWRSYAPTMGYHEPQNG